MLEEKAAHIKLFVVDVDGVMTDGRITINDSGEETKSFDVKDGLGLKMLSRQGIEVVILTGRESGVVAHRARELGIHSVYQGVADKRETLRRLISQKGMNKSQVCAMGDDLPDLAMFEEAGLCIAVSDAVSEVRRNADVITRRRGGFGAVREACDWILSCRDASSKMNFTE
jgi:YrbI family 3-deoxy-D-manno-octulosonate 8-phosphate phosphatase